jgi:hypothetical protein
MLRLTGRKDVSRHLKKYEVTVDKQKIVRAPHVLILTHDPEDEKVGFSIHGNMNLDELLNTTNTVTLELLSMWMKKADPMDERPTLRREVHDRAVTMFSMIMNMFDPTVAEDKWDGLTEEAVLKAQNDLLKEKRDALLKRKD